VLLKGEVESADDETVDVVLSMKAGVPGRKRG
jgi:hypothetical protein